MAEPPALATYQYQPLGSQGDIRLVELLPSQKRESNISAIISCRLHQVSFHDSPVYEAVSYHWGDPSVTLPIILDGKSFHVTKNLAEALQCLTPTEESRLLWIDAICINQTDNFERSHQVQQMAKIYKDAKRVLICFGLGDSDTLAAFQRLIKEEEYKTSSLQELDMRRNLRITDEIRVTQKKNFNEVLDADSENDDELYAELPILRKPTLGLAEPTKSETSAIDTIFQHPWWERVWVIQEATVARELCIICGRYELPWNILCQIYPAAFTIKPGQLALSPHEKNLKPKDLTVFGFNGNISRLNYHPRDLRLSMIPTPVMDKFDSILTSWSQPFDLPRQQILAIKYTLSWDWLIIVMTLS
jgi:hypothetical protein